MNYIVVIDNPNYLGGIRYIERFFKILESKNEEFTCKIITINFNLSDSFLSTKSENLKVNKFLYKLDKVVARVLKYSFYSVFFSKNNPNSIFWFSDIFLSNNDKIKYNVKVVNWIPDFQFLDYPQYFSLLNKISRYFYLRLQLTSSDIIVLQSKVDKDRLINLHPKYSAKYFIWQFYEPIKLNIHDSLPSNIPKKYFLYPHQMWKHKRHDLVIEFFAKNVNYNLVLTGQLIDPRDSTYTQRIKNMLNPELKNIFLLGKVSSVVLDSLMKNADAILNFSEYEGWSSCVEEAISFNVPLILNSLSINIEQIPSAYFIDITQNTWEKDLIDIINKLEKPSYNLSLRKKKSFTQLDAILNYLN